MPDIDLTKLFLGKNQEQQVKELLNNLTILVASAQEVLTNANKSIEDINEITRKLKGILK